MGQDDGVGPAVGQPVMAAQRTVSYTHLEGKAPGFVDHIVDLFQQLVYRHRSSPFLIFSIISGMMQPGTKPVMSPPSPATCLTRLEAVSYTHLQGTNMQMSRIHFLSPSEAPPECRFGGISRNIWNQYSIFPA